MVTWRRRHNDLRDAQGLEGGRGAGPWQPTPSILPSARAATQAGVLARALLEVDDVGALGSEATSSRSSLPTEYSVSPRWQSPATGPLWSLELDRRNWGPVSKTDTVPSCPAAARMFLSVGEKESPSLGVVPERAMLTFDPSRSLMRWKSTSPETLERGKTGHDAAQHSASLTKKDER